MGIVITEESFDWFTSCWRDNRYGLRWTPFFILPPWLHAWRQSFAPETRFHFLTGWQGEQVIGIAPLMLKEQTASIIGSPDVCDYVDLVVVPGKGDEFCMALLNDLKKRGISLIDAVSVRPDSIVMTSMSEVARQQGCDVTYDEDDITLERDLPATWDEYLQYMNKKQRHEVRRKMRRLEEEGMVNYRLIEDREALPGFMDIFLKQFVESREDKADFMTEDMERFFRSMTGIIYEAGLLRPSVLELDNVPVAALISFEYDNVVYLYNSGFDPNYRSLSVGVTSKSLCIKNSIERGIKKFDFLKGDENYKYHLGGQEIQLYRCQITL